MEMYDHMSLMVLGPSSHAGKSTVVAAICRVLSDLNISSAPFKSQNMSLNSFVTRDGCEIGIAQAIQARAARLEPMAEMNPILLKPKGDSVSQVILLGKPYRDVPAREYYTETEFLLSKALDAARTLERRFGHLVVEGAGGAAEVNLYSRDIANILLARSLRYPILLVADIERGGVFAQVYGTISLLPPDISPLVMGIIINKFRGDPSLFSRGKEIIEEITGVPVIGILPHIPVGLPSEDSLSLEDKRTTASPVRIGIIRLPHISNFTDFEALERCVGVEYVPLGSPLSGFDCIIIPGTKNTVDDLDAMWRSGTADEIRKSARLGIPVIGICGGFQMLGKEIIDSGVESRAGTFPGLGLLDIVTRFERYEKKTEQVTRRARPVGPILAAMGTVSGYEIHMGKTFNRGEEEAFEGEGAASSTGLVFGTYLHGLFSNQSAIDALCRYLHEKKGLSCKEREGSSDPYDELARAFLEHVTIDPILSCFR